MQRITSRQNPIVAEFRAVARGDAGESMLLDGVHLLSDALNAGVLLRHVLVASDALERDEVARLLARLPRETDIIAASAPVLEAASPVRSASPVVALAMRPVPSADVYAGPRPLVVIASDIQDPGNLGAIIRVAEAAGASGAVICGQSADPFSWKALRGSMGSALRLPIRREDRVDDAVTHARRRGFRIVATVPRDGLSPFECDLTRPTALLIGGEGPGLPAGIVAEADLRVTIPMTPPVESLNTAVAAAVLLYEARRQRQTREAQLAAT